MDLQIYYFLIISICYYSVDFTCTGYQINNIVQCKPPASVTAINVQAHWGLIGFGTSHGFSLFDYQQVSELHA